MTWARGRASSGSTLKPVEPVYARAFLSGWQSQLMVTITWATRPSSQPTSRSPIAAEALRHIGQLYAIEQRGHDLAPTQRLRLRQDQAKPLLADWHVWLLASHESVVAVSGTAKAIDRRCCVTSSPVRCPIDNNLVEKTSCQHVEPFVARLHGPKTVEDVRGQHLYHGVKDERQEH